MENFANTGKYRELLRMELAVRCEHNPRYSLRSFARDLKLSPSRLSDVLRGRYGLSKSAALDIAKRAGWSEEERAYFGDLVESEHSRSEKARAEAKLRVQAAKPISQKLSLDAFKVISDWYHYAILELMSIPNALSDEAWIARRLGLHPNIVAEAIHRLSRLELLEISSAGLRPTDSFTASPSGIPSEAIKKFHRQVLEKAISAISLQTVNERDFSSTILAIDPKYLPEAARDIKKFRRAFDRKYGSSGVKNEVYCLSMQLFSLENQRPPKGKK